MNLNFGFKKLNLLSTSQLKLLAKLAKIKKNTDIIGKGITVTATRKLKALSWLLESMK